MKKLEAVLLTAGSLFFLYGVFSLFLNLGANMGTFFPIGVGALLILYVICKRKYSCRAGNFYFKKFEKIAAWLFAAFLVLFAILIVLLALYASSDDSGDKTECVIVLGAALNGEEPSQVLNKRLELAVNYISRHEGAMVIVTGGQGRGESIPEAEAMKRYLVSHGVNDENILKEEYSTSTMENLAFSKALFEREFGHSPGTVTIVTSDFHRFRAKLLAARVGLNAQVLGADTPYYIYPNVYSREFFALIKSVIFDWPKADRIGQLSGIT
jgi:uncharacterized SAM-binding protein YcdF (DUF218 family)